MFASLGDRAVNKGGVRALEKRTRPDIQENPTGFRAAVEALLPKERRGRAGYAEDNLKGMTIAQATEINEDALRFYGIPPGTWNTSAEYRDVVRYRSDSDESDSDDE